MSSVTAERGAAFLDERVPGWADMVDVDALDLEHAGNCVVGQIERRLHPRARFPMWQSFDRGKADLGISDKEALRYGFHGARTGRVQRTWKRLIRERQTVETEA